jgi:hypothetical protein
MRLARRLPGTVLAALFALAPLALALGLDGCGDTLQDRPIEAGPFESVIVKSRFPVYWMGLRFARLRVTAVSSDPGGAVTLRYGDCTIGGQYTCVTPLSIVTSPDNSFVPGPSQKGGTLHVRGVSARSLQGGTTITLPTGAVVVSVYAHDPSLARAAVQIMTPLNERAAPQARLPQPLPDSGFGRIPLPSQLPPGTG